MERMLRSNAKGKEVDAIPLSSEMAWSKPNPFHAPPVLRSLMKNVHLPTGIKRIRNTCDLWNQVAVAELEKQLFQETIQPLNLSWRWSRKRYRYIKHLTNPELMSRMNKFFEDTQTSPNLFRRFHFNYPQFLEVINEDNFQPLLFQYPINFLSLDLDEYNYRTAILAEDVELLNTFLDRVAPHLYELQLFETLWFEVKGHRLEDSSSHGWKDGRFPSLRKLALQGEKAAELFKKIWGAGEFPVPNCTFLFIKIRDADFGDLFGPSVNWAQLTHLDIGGPESYENPLLSILNRTNWLLSLAQAGMSLKFFCMHLDCDLNGEDEEVDFHQTFAHICSNLTEFFSTQADSLEDLRIINKVKYCPTDAEIEADLLKVAYPVFSRLLRLEIYNYRCRNHESPHHDPLGIMTFHSYNYNFPALEDLTILGMLEDIDEWGGEYEEEEPLTLKRLKVSDGRRKDPDRKTIEDDHAHLLKLVRSVETLEVGLATERPWTYDFFIREGEELPWIDSLKVLHVYMLDQPLKLGHLKNLKTIVIEHRGFELWDVGSNLLRQNQLDPDYKRFLKNFIHIAKMDLELIRFRGFKISKAIRAEIVKYFPYRVEFVKKPLLNWNPHRVIRESDFI